VAAPYWETQAGRREARGVAADVHSRWRTVNTSAISSSPSPWPRCPPARGRATQTKPQPLPVGWDRRPPGSPLGSGRVCRILCRLPRPYAAFRWKPRQRSNPVAGRKPNRSRGRVRLPAGAAAASSKGCGPTRGYAGREGLLVLRRRRPRPRPDYSCTGVRVCCDDPLSFGR
jgi:hypothetical protein